MTQTPQDAGGTTAYCIGSLEGDAKRHYTPENYPLTQNIGFHLNLARNRLRAEMDAALCPMEITTTEMTILWSVMEDLASTPLRLSKTLGIDSGQMARCLEALKCKGMLCRQRSTEDRRLIPVALTDKGREVAAHISEIVVTVLNQRLQHFSENEFHTFQRLLQKFMDDGSGHRSGLHDSMTPVPVSAYLTEAARLKKTPRPSGGAKVVHQGQSRERP